MPAKNLSVLLFALLCLESFAIAAPGLDPDNESHRSLSDKLDKMFDGNPGYEKIDRPLIHGTYHALRYAFNGGNPEEWARAKDQYSKFGTGQQRTEYLEAYRNNDDNN